jgi:hypothetical protein
MPDRNIPTRRGVKTYKSRSKHQIHGFGSYSKWKSQAIEIETFDNADCGTVINGVESSWECDNHLWGFIKNNNIETIGTEKQQFGFFPATQNIPDDWHGYPVFPFKEKNKKYDICKNLLKFWEDNDELTADEIAVLIKGKLL